jgi:3-dehydroquinate dehydratase/shikimate dehydrogenase
MFVQQGARQFEIFTGKPAPEEEMFRVVLHSLRQAAETAAAEHPQPTQKAAKPAEAVPKPAEHAPKPSAPAKKPVTKPAAAKTAAKSAKAPKPAPKSKKH